MTGEGCVSNTQISDPAQQSKTVLSHKTQLTLIGDRRGLRQQHVQHGLQVSQTAQAVLQDLQHALIHGGSAPVKQRLAWEEID